MRPNLRTVYRDRNSRQRPHTIVKPAKERILMIDLAEVVPRSETTPEVINIQMTRLKIVDHISMMRAGIITIMALRSKLLSTAADGIPLEVVRSPLFRQVAVVAFRGPSGGNVRSARAQYLIEVVRGIQARQSDLSVVLFIMDCAWKIDTRVANYYRLWKQLAKEGYQLPANSEFPDYALHADHKVKFWGAVALEQNDIEEADRALRSRDGCIMLCRRVDSTRLQGIVNSNFSAKTQGCSALAVCMEYVAGSGGFCVYPSGAFDDADVSIYVVGSTDSVMSSGISFDVNGPLH